MSIDAPPSAAPAPTSARERLRPMARSIFGLLAGYCAILLLWFLCYLLLLFVLSPAFDAHGNPAGVSAAAGLIVATTLCAFVGGSLAVRLARRTPMVHAGLLAAMEGATLMTWARDSDALAPAWFAVLFVALPVLAILTAGILRRR